MFTDSILVAVVYVIDSTIRILDTMSHLTNTIKFMHLYLATLITFEPLERLGSFHLPWIWWKYSWIYPLPQLEPREHDWGLKVSCCLSADEFQILVPSYGVTVSADVFSTFLAALMDLVEVTNLSWTSWVDDRHFFSLLRISDVSHNRPNDG